MSSILLRGVFTRSLEELRDPWAIAIAEVAAVLAYALGRSGIEAVSVATSVLVVRVAAGVLLPIPPGPLPEPARISMRALQIRSYIDKGWTDQRIAGHMKVSERYVVRVRREYVRPKPPGIPQSAQLRWFEQPIVRGTLTAAGFLSLGWTVYNILRTILGIQ